MNIHIVEDDSLIRGELSLLLSTYGYTCSSTNDFRNIVEDVIHKNPDLLLLDINLPYVDGYHICRELRKISDMPIIVVSSRNTQMDELMSMNLGADDFISKPYNTPILLARIGAVLNRVNKVHIQEIIKYKGLIYEPAKGQVCYGDKQRVLSKNEQQLLYTLLKNKERILMRSELMDALWQTDNFIDDNTLTVNMNRLRKSLEDIGILDLIITKRGQGYMV